MGDAAENDEKNEQIRDRSEQDVGALYGDPPDHHRYGQIGQTDQHIRHDMHDQDVQTP